MKNKEVREAMKKAGVAQWQLADLVGCSENTIQRKLRKELPEDMKRHLLEVIRNHRKDGEAGVSGMTRDDYIKDLLDTLQGFNICMCPASKEYWREHWKEVQEGLRHEAQNGKHTKVQ